MKTKHNTLHYLVAALKAYGINHIVASPGIQNSCFNLLVQETPGFQCHSVIDERSAAYVATGLIRELEEPVVITCTGATSSRNFLPAMTEAFYSKLPIIAITFFNPISTPYNLEPQYLDRRITQNDVKSLTVELPIIHNQEDIDKCLTLLNVALCNALYQKEPVHINCPANTNFAIDVSSLPSIWSTQYYEDDFEYLREELVNKKFMIFIGSHDKFSEEETSAISNFAKSWDIPVVCDHTSNYKGENKVLLSRSWHYFKSAKESPDIIIDIGNITGNYHYKKLFKKSVKIWKITNNGLLKSRNNVPVTNLFKCKEKYFFKSLINDNKKTIGYYKATREMLDKWKVPQLNLSNPLICEYLAKHIPNNSSLHCSIIQSLKCLNYFELDNSIDVYCNVGGFGIDGAVSSLVGQSFANPNRKIFGLIGDLAFFYDMNAIGNREISNNIRIILVNNSKGVEFRLGGLLEKYWGDKIDVLVAAGGHNKQGAQGWAEACGFEYMNARTKEDFVNQIDKFCNGEFNKPVLFEVFTDTTEERTNKDKITNYNRNKIELAAVKIYHALER